ncbi:hypothetical protein F5I97DRAFT_1932552 [Phlebopus sp. FC_14]|nr:hypothetical protein F5I97DRAFT_1932552 [Phlebopus sp. FC_14]
MKKVTLIAAERSAEKRLDYLTRIGQYTAEQLVFIDESSDARQVSPASASNSQQLRQHHAALHEPPASQPSRILEAVTNVLSVITGGSLDHVDLETDMYMEDESHLSSETNLDDVEYEDGDDDDLQLNPIPMKHTNIGRCPRTMAVKPTLACGVYRSTKARVSVSDTENTMTDAIDIAFKIHCAVHRLQGSNVSNVMFDIYSSYSFDHVRNLVAEKLGRYPALVQLQWPLDTDKPKTPSTSIQDDEEFNMFYERVRPFFTIKHTATGKISTRPRKNVLVHFEDGGLNINNIPPAGNNMKSTNTKSRSSSSKQKASNLDDELEGSEDHKKYIVELQQKYMYEAHLRGSESPIYCYRQPGTNVCYALFHHNIAGWALEILCGNATVVQRPAGLLNLTARSRTRSSGATNSNMINPPDQQPPASTPVPTPFPYPYLPPAAPPVIVFPPSWGVAPQSQVTQYNTVPSTTPVSQPSKSPLPSPYASTSPLSPVGTREYHGYTHGW